MSVMSVAGVLHAPLTSKSTCLFTVKISLTSAESVKKCSLALARSRNTFELTQVYGVPSITFVWFDPFTQHSLFSFFLFQTSETFFFPNNINVDGNEFAIFQRLSLVYCS